METLFKKFTLFLHKECLQGQTGKLLLAVSGGLDSAVMLHLFLQTEINCEVAHCNFQLRSTESDADEEFVRELAGKAGLIYYSKRFTTAAFATENGISIQMAARQLRYNYFDELMERNSLFGVATAHHANDVAETMLLNLTKGTGLAGMHGIKPLQGKIIRPLLFASRKELETYAKTNGLTWREDASNAEIYYQRNRIRHHVVPQLEEINPLFTEAMLHHAKLVRGYESMLSDYISKMESSMVTLLPGGKIRSVALMPLLQSVAPVVLLYHILKPYGAGAALCEDILSAKQSGTVFYSNGVKIVRERDSLCIYEKSDNSDDELFVHYNQEILYLLNGHIQIESIILNKNENFQTRPDFAEKNTAYIDASWLKFPLMVRKWKNADAFQPLGMKGKKLLSDFFIDSKFSSSMKEGAYILLSGDEVVWIVDCRIDERFKVCEDTRECLRFTFVPLETRS